MENLPSPFNDRVIKQCMPPPRFPLSHEELFPKNDGMPDWKLVKEHLIKEGRLYKADIIEIIRIFKEIVRNEPNVLKVNDPVTIIGDLHGQFYDLLKSLELAGAIEEVNYVFLGDYVDRGSFSLEILILLFCMKINFKSSFLMLRGNHECKQMTTYFNFKNECEIKQDIDIYEEFIEAFNCLPICCIVNEKFILVHGGISPDIKRIEEIKKLDRFHEPEKSGPICDLLWSDPYDKNDDAINIGWMKNVNRGCSYIFGGRAANYFLNKNNYISIIRAHESQLDGYKFYKWNKKNADFPTVITVFSAPNYCDVYNNKAAIVKIRNSMINVKQYKYSSHPFVLPDFMNIFSWSVPFVSEKISEMLIYIIKQNFTESELQEINDNKNRIIEDKITDSLRMKFNFLIIMMKMYRTLREESELIMKLKGFCPGNKIPKGILIQGPKALKTALERYSKAKQLDAVNEMMPKNYE